MKASKFSDAQKAFILKQGADGIPMAEICRRAGISQATYFNWKKRYDGLLPAEMKRLKQLEDENGKLTKLVADLSLTRKCCNHSRRQLNPIRIRQSEYLNNRIEQNHRRIKRRRPLGSSGCRRSYTQPRVDSGQHRGKLERIREKGCFPARPLHCCYANRMGLLAV